MTLNEHVLFERDYLETADRFTPEDGYALYVDDTIEPYNENGEPNTYCLQIITAKQFTEDWAPHIWARLIDDTMEVFGKTNPERPAVMSLKARAAVATITTDDESTLTETPSSHTYIDENGVERPKRGVY